MFPYILVVDSILKTQTVKGGVMHLKSAFAIINVVR